VCKKWVHNKCSGVKGKQKEGLECKNKAASEEDKKAATKKSATAEIKTF
jgi:hypothetical protein